LVGIFDFAVGEQNHPEGIPAPASSSHGRYCMLVAESQQGLRIKRRRSALK
jgi:hypothetical protein